MATGNLQTEETAKDTNLQSVIQLVPEEKLLTSLLSITTGFENVVRILGSPVSLVPTGWSMVFDHSGQIYYRHGPYAVKIVTVSFMPPEGTSSQDRTQDNRFEIIFAAIHEIALAQANDTVSVEPIEIPTDSSGHGPVIYARQYAFAVSAWQKTLVPVDDDTQTSSPPLLELLGTLA